MFTSDWSITDVEHLLKNIMKAFLSTWIGFAFIKCCSDDKNLVLTQKSIEETNKSEDSEDQTVKIVNGEVNEAFVAELNNVVERNINDDFH